MTSEDQRVAELIRTAFAGVTLGNGVGLRQAQGLDNYASDEELERLRSHDEQLDWAKIPAADLNRCYSSLSFFDAEGMRFHLPAFMLGQLDETFRHDVIFHLVSSHHYGLSPFEMLNDLQRHAIREFLLLRLADEHCEFERPMIEAAIAEQWHE